MAVFKKPAITFVEQVKLLKARGLTIQHEGEDRVIRHLSSISYYRLSAYILPFKEAILFSMHNTIFPTND